MDARTELKRDNFSLKPTNIMRHVYAVYPAFAMLAAMQLDLFTQLKDGPLEAKALANDLDVLEEKLTPLLYSLVAAGLLEMKDKSFFNTPETDKFLVRGRPDYFGEVCEFYNKQWHAVLNTAESIRTGKPQAKHDWYTLSVEKLREFFRSQYHNSVRGGNEIADKLDFSKYKVLLDAGGGSGGTSIAICNKYPQITATIADLPKVVQVAEGFIADAGMSDRISVMAIDLCLSSPQGRYEVAILRAFIQTLSRDQAQMAIKHISQSLVKGGRLIIFGSVLANSCLAPAAALASGLVFLNVYDQGKAYTENEYQEMLIEAGFTNITIKQDAFADGMSIISAIKI